MLLSFLPTQNLVENNILSFPFLVKNCMTHSITDPTRKKSPCSWGSRTKGNNNNKCSVTIVGAFHFVWEKQKGGGARGEGWSSFAMSWPSLYALFILASFFLRCYCCCPPSSPSCKWPPFLGFFPELHLVYWSALQLSLFSSNVVILFDGAAASLPFSGFFLSSSCHVPAEKAIATMEPEWIRKWAS
jgi:hypothetical protein